MLGAWMMWGGGVLIGMSLGWYACMIVNNIPFVPMTRKPQNQQHGTAMMKRKQRKPPLTFLDVQNAKDQLDAQLRSDRLLVGASKRGPLNVTFGRDLTPEEFEQFWSGQKPETGDRGSKK